MVDISIYCFTYVKERFMQIFHLFYLVHKKHMRHSIFVGLRSKDVINFPSFKKYYYVYKL